MEGEGNVFLYYLHKEFIYLIYFIDTAKVKFIPVLSEVMGKQRQN